MTFEQFQTTKAYCTDIGEAIRDDMGGQGPVSGNLYLGSLHILDRNTPNGKWYLLIGRCDWISDDLEMLEHKLYDFAVSEGFFE